MNAPELAELVDHTGTPTGHVVDRWSELHPTLLLPVVIVVVMNTAGEVAVHQRGASRYRGGCLDHVAGCVRWNPTKSRREIPIRAAMRETREEIGARIERPRLLRTEVTDNSTGRRRYRWLYLARYNGPLAVRDPDEVQWVRFATVEELRQWQTEDRYPFTPRFFPDLTHAAARHPVHAARLLASGDDPHATLPENLKVTGDARDQLGADLARRYNAGATLRALCAHTGRSYGFVSAILHERDDVQWRPTGRSGPRTPPAARSTEVQ